MFILAHAAMHCPCAHLQGRRICSARLLRREDLASTPRRSVNPARYAAANQSVRLPVADHGHSTCADIKLNILASRPLARPGMGSHARHDSGKL